MPTIHELVDSGAWERVRQRLKSLGGKDHDQFRSSNLDEAEDDFNPFHFACSKEDVPQDIIRAMLGVDEKNLFVATRYKGTPLHIACELGSVATVKTLLMIASDNEKLLRQYARAEDAGGSTALHITWSRLFYSDALSYLGLPTGNTDTPSEFLHNLESITSPRDLQGKIKDTWDKTVLLLKACATGTVDGGSANAGQWNVVHSIVHTAKLSKVPSIVLWLALKLFPEQARWKDGDGNMPLHVAASASEVSVSRAYLYPMFIEYEELDDEARSVYEQSIETPMRMVLNLYPDAAKIPNNSGRLPLHVALHHESITCETIALLLKAAPKSVDCRDPSTMLFPFMLAACDLEDDDLSEDKRDAMLDATYVLLRENPANVQGGIRLTEYETYLSHKVSEQKQRIAELECQLRRRERGDD